MLNNKFMKKIIILFLVFVGLFACEKNEDNKGSLCEVNISELSNITNVSAIIYGNITYEGDPVYFERGFCYSTSSNPTIQNNKISIEGSSMGSKGLYAGELKELSKNTTYYVKAYATNDVGIAYSEEQKFTTEDLDIKKDLVAYYSFDNKNLTESQGKSQYNGILPDVEPIEFSTDIPGNTGFSAQFNGNSYFITLQNPLSDFFSQKADLTISLWIKTMSTNTSFLETGVIPNGYGLTVGIYNGIVHYYYAYVGGFRRFNYSEGEFLYNGDWHFVVVTYNINDPEILVVTDVKLFLDGNLLATATIQGATPLGSSSGKDLFIGKGFIGKMDNLRVYNRELTQAEITELFNAKQ